MKARTIARYVTIAAMGLAVLVATGDGFAQSYSGLYGWGLEHGLAGWKADSFPLMVDLFVGIGEMGLFLIAIDGHRLRKSLLSWVDLLLPASIAAAGWTASLVFNVGHVKVHDFATEATAAVPPLASMIGLLVLLRTLHRYVTSDSAEVAPVQAIGPVAVDAETIGFEDVDDTPEALMAWLKGEDVPAVPAPDPHHVAAVEKFGDEVRGGKVPGIRAIRRALHVGQPRAQEIQAYLSVLATK
jgi:hypothetical protein